jgi:hypothetical protein
MKKDKISGTRNTQEEKLHTKFFSKNIKKGEN